MACGSIRVVFVIPIYVSFRMCIMHGNICESISIVLSIDPGEKQDIKSCVLSTIDVWFKPPGLTPSGGGSGAGK